MLYSATTRGFYLENVHKNIPSDVVEISKERYQQLLLGQEQGLEITANTLTGIPELQSPVLTPNMLIAGIITERARRLSLGFDYNFGDARGIHRIGTTETDMKGWDEVTKATQAMIGLGLGAMTIDIVTDTAPVTITAIEWQQILLAAAQFRQPFWVASFILQAMDPIPEDYTNDVYWKP